MEKLLHYVWKHKLFPLTQLHTADGQAVEVIDPGLPNRHAGPDFFNAKIKIGGTLWVGNVEIHDRAADWYAHGHDSDERYNNVILHVCRTLDAEARTQAGLYLPQLALPIPAEVHRNYTQLLATDDYPPCYRVIPTLGKLTTHSWMTALQTERLEQKIEAIAQRVQQFEGSWEEAAFATLARNFGFGVNGEAFEVWAHHLPLQQTAHHRDSLFQTEAIFMGQAGLLCPETVPQHYREKALSDDYFIRLSNEYHYLAHKFGLQPMDGHQWKFLRLRPQNFPYIRISQLARLYVERKASLSELTELESIADFNHRLKVGTSPYWETHYVFGSETSHRTKMLSTSSIQLLLINTVAPLLFAYGQHIQKEALCQRAFDLLEKLKAENNHIVRLWQEVGLAVENAGDSQALIQLKRQYCDHKDCLRCRFGYEYLKSRPSTPL